MRCIPIILLTLFIVAVINISSAAQNTDPDLKTPASAKSGGTINGKQAQMTDIHDIKPPVKMGFDNKLLIYLAAAVLTVLLIAALIYYLKKRRKKENKISRAPDAPEDIAFRSLDELMVMQQALNGKEFYYRLSLIIRNYIQGRYSINAPEMTTEEFIPEIKNLGISRDLQKSLKDFAITSDPVKFAGVAADRSKITSDLEFAKGFVKQTIPTEVGKEESDKR